MQSLFNSLLRRLAGTVVLLSILASCSAPQPTGAPASSPSPTVAPPSPSATPTPTLAQRLDLTSATTQGLTLHYAPTTAPIQVQWVVDTYARAKELLPTTLAVPLTEATVYLLDQEAYTQIIGGNHPEWTQGYFREGEAYINRAPSLIWDESVPEEERQGWLGLHIKEITQMITAHELTHLALREHRLPRWLDEGLAQYVEAKMAPPESAARLLLQRRYKLRAAMIAGLLPTAAQLASPNWATDAQGEADLHLLYDVSALIVQAVAGQQQEDGVRRLVASRGAETPVDALLRQTLQPWLNTPLPEEQAALVLCGLNRFLALKDQATDAWDKMVDSPTPVYLGFQTWLQLLAADLDGLPADTLVEEIRATYANSVAWWNEALESYSQGDFLTGNRLFRLSTTLSNTANHLLPQAWGVYLIVPCPLLEAQLP
ncbi:MAG: hypothetical protein EXR55_01155 [Dehalococcoidia bacterium]|nr:hypothetical protein [Dehalococcoidia bacterium]